MIASLLDEAPAGVAAPGKKLVKFRCAACGKLNGVFVPLEHAKAVSVPGRS